MAAPSSPSWLCEKGKAVWRRLVKQLPGIEEKQLDTLAILCAAWAGYFGALEDIRSKGRVIESGTRLFVNPACNVMTEERKTIVKLSKMFGLTPDGGPPDDDDNSPFRDLLTRGDDD